MRRLKLLPPLLAAFLAAGPSAATTVGDLVRLRGVRSNHLVGLGLVVGLRGTGDASGATREAVSRFSASCGFGAGLDGDDFAPANSALVALTAELPPFLHAGQRIDVTVSACADAKDLAGGTLVTTPLWAGSPEEVYARAQGPVSTGRPEEAATVGRVRLGGIIEREPAPVLSGEFTTVLERGRITLDLRRPSPQAAAAVAEAVSEAFPMEMLVADIRVASPGEVRIALGGEARAEPVRFLAKLLDTRVRFDAPARIVVNERLGTVAAPGRIEIAPAAVSTARVSVTIGRREAPAAQGVARERPLVSVREGAELQELVRELQRMQVSSRELIAILDGLVKIGALRAEIVVE